MPPVDKVASIQPKVASIESVSTSPSPCRLAAEKAGLSGGWNNTAVRTPNP